MSESLIKLTQTLFFLAAFHFGSDLFIFQRCSCAVCFLAQTTEKEEEGGRSVCVWGGSLLAEMSHLWRHPFAEYTKFFVFFYQTSKGRCTVASTAVCVRDAIWLVYETRQTEQ